MTVLLCGWLVMTGWLKALTNGARNIPIASRLVFVFMFSLLLFREQASWGNQLRRIKAARGIRGIGVLKLECESGGGVRLDWQPRHQVRRGFQHVGESE